MLHFTGGLLLFAAYTAALPWNEPLAQGPGQQVLKDSLGSKSTERKLQGRFLHITDVHPDPYYKVHSSPKGAHPCHANSGKGSAGYYGAEISSCDTPFSLVNATFQWIRNHLKDHIDFVVWTGDSARHDNDEQYPRHDRQVEDLNRFVVQKFFEVFGKGDAIDATNRTDSFTIPIVPTFGNNDILPHNIFQTGPNRWTRKYEDIWKGFIPQGQRHSFARGGWFFTEVIPNRLAVFSLNTLYFFDSNSAVDGCDSKSEPGYEHMEWLRIQLQFLRTRGMKAILIGHVPPARTDSKQNWDETCFQKYTLWMRQYRDVILASMFGHMNVDHFIVQDVEDLTYKFHIDGVDEEFRREKEIKFHTEAKTAYLNELRNRWSQLPAPPEGSSYSSLEDVSEQKDKKKKKKNRKKEVEKFLKTIGGPYGERFSLSLVSPSIVPNYFPTLRVVEYNITGMENDHPASRAIGEAVEVEFDSFAGIFEELNIDARGDDGFDIDNANEQKEHSKKKKKKKKKKKPKKPNFPVPDPPSKTAAPGPAYSSQPLSLLSWTQYYANLTAINAAVEADRDFVEGTSNHKHFAFEIEYSTNNDTHYQMEDLTVRSWLDLAERIGRKKNFRGKDLEVGQELESDLEAPESEADEEADDEAEEMEGETRVEESDDNQSEDEGVDTQKHKKKKKKKKKKKPGKRKVKNKLWKTFVRRAFVLSKAEKDLDDDFGQPVKND